MKRNILVTGGIIGMICLGLSIGCITVYAQSTAILSASLQRHEAQLDHLTLIWSLAETSGDVSVPVAKQKPRQEKVNVATDDSGHAAITAGLCKFIRDGKVTVIQDTLNIHQSTPAATIALSNYWYFDGNLGLYADISSISHFASTPGAIPMRPLPGYVWTSAGDAARFNSPNAEYLPLLPEDLALFSGFNAFSMRGTVWQAVFTTPDSYVIETSTPVGDQGSFTLKLTLSRAHDNLPSAMNEGYKNHQGQYSWTRTYRVNAYEKYGNLWLPSQVTYDLYGIGSSDHRSWNLRSVSKATPTPLNLPIGVYMSDYRLLGKDAANAIRYNDPNIVSYYWPGYLPDEAQLKNKRKQ